MSGEQIKTSRFYNYPKINMPFKPKFHKDFENIYKEVYQWYVHYKQISSEAEEKKLKAFVQLACYCYPEGIYERVVLMGKETVLVFELDDDIEVGNIDPYFSWLMDDETEIDVPIAMLDKSNEYDCSRYVLQFSNLWCQLKSLSNKNGNEDTLKISFHT